MPSSTNTSFAGGGKTRTAPDNREGFGRQARARRIEEIAERAKNRQSLWSGAQPACAGGWSRTVNANGKPHSDSKSERRAGEGAFEGRGGGGALLVAPAAPPRRR